MELAHWLFDFLWDLTDQRRHLRDVIPQCEQLRAEPRRFLSEQTVRIGPVILWLRAGGLCLLCLLLIWVPWELGFLETWLIRMLGLVALVAAITYNWKCFGPRCHEMFLHREGIELRHGPDSVCCPWALFNAPGSGFVAGARHLLPTISLPVAPSAIHLVEHRRNGETVARGMAVNTPQIKFDKSDEAVITLYYEVFPDELLELLKDLKSQLAGPLPDAAPLSELKIEEAFAAPEPADGWIELAVGGLAFPPFCCGCGTRTTDQMKCEFGQGHKIEFSIPFCSDCLATLQRQKWKGRIIGMGAAAILAVQVIVLLRLLTHVDDMVLDNVNKFFLLVIFLATLCIGWLAGRSIAYRRGLPLEVRYWYGTRLKIRFRHPQYAVPFLKTVHGPGSTEDFPDGPSWL